MEYLKCKMGGRGDHFFFVHRWDKRTRSNHVRSSGRNANPSPSSERKDFHHPFSKGGCGACPVKLLYDFPSFSSVAELSDSYIKGACSDL